MTDGNYQAADAYHARICEEERRLERILKDNPPTCPACHESNLTPDKTWCWCFAVDEWVRYPFKCFDEDCFDPKCK